VLIGTFSSQGATPLDHGLFSFISAPSHGGFPAIL